MKNIYIALLVVVMMAWFVTADIPDMPEIYQGYATINSSLATNGTFIDVRVNGTNESVGNTTINASNGAYTLIVYFDINETNDTDEGAVSGELLTWFVNGSQAGRPVPANDTANPGGVNDLFVVSVGETPLKIVDYSPSSSTPVVNENSSITFTVTAIGPVNSNLTYNWTVNGVTQSNSSSLIYNSSVGENGTKNVTVRVSNGTTLETNSWNLTINRLPVITPTVPNITTKSNTITDFNLTPYESDYESSGTGLNWSVSDDNPSIATISIDSATDILTVIPRPDVYAIDYVTLTLTDSYGGMDTQEVAIIIEPKCSGIDAPVSGDWNITSNTSCSNVNITLSENANLNVIGNVTLEFDNVTLILDNGTLMAYDAGNANGVIDSIWNTIIDWIT
jgi:hypothetical protein